MKIDITCPVEIAKCTIDKKDNNTCSFTLNNVSLKTINSVQVTLQAKNERKQIIFTQTERIIGLQVVPYARFSASITPNQETKFSNVSLIIDKVWFSDVSIWRSSQANFLEYTSNTLPEGEELNKLKAVIGKDAVGYPVLYTRLWLCVCGRPNPLRNTLCQRCQRNKAAVFTHCHPKNVETAWQLQQKEKLAKEDTENKDAENKDTENKENENKEDNTAEKNKEKTVKENDVVSEKKKKSYIKIVVTLIIVFVLAAIIYFGMPFFRYQFAQFQLNNSKIEEARNTFTDLDGYLDSEDKLLACDFAQAEQLLQTGTIENLELAQTQFFNLGEYGTSAEKYLETSYELGELYLKNLNYEEAAAQFYMLGDYKDAKTRLNETTYQQAIALIDFGNIELALVLLNGLGEYKDSATKASTLVFESAEKKYSNKEYLSAYETLLLADQTPTTIELEKEYAYQYAQSEYEKDNLLVAGEYFLLALDYSDAIARANDSFYTYALKKKEEGAFKEATEIFLRISGYLDSEGQAALCLIEQAVDLAEEKELEVAVALLETVQYSAQAQEYLNLWRHEIADAAYLAGDFVKAEHHYSLLGNYLNSASRLEASSYALAEADFEKENYSDALKRYQELGNYKDSKTKSNLCAYTLAEEALAHGDTDMAMELYANLGKYSDSDVKFDNLLLNKADALFSEGKEEEGIALLENYPNSKGATDKLFELSLEKADALFSEGKYNEAEEAYLALGENLNATEGVSKTRYAKAVKFQNDALYQEAIYLFTILGKYSDSATRLDECFVALYGTIVEDTKTAMDSKDYLTVVQLLNNFPKENLPKKYEHLPKNYRKACYELAESLYNEGKPYQALPLYLQVQDYFNIKNTALRRKAYKILGTWKNDKDEVIEFNANGQCTIDNQNLYFRVDNTTVYTGDSFENLTHTHNIYELTDDKLIIINLTTEEQSTENYKRESTLDFNTVPLLPIGNLE